MSNRFEDRAEDLAGRGKEAVGAVTGDDSLKAEGEADQKRAAVKGKVEDLKDKIKDKIDDVL